MVQNSKELLRKYWVTWFSISSFTRSFAPLTHLLPSSWESEYRILRNKRLPPNKRLPSLFVIRKYIELKRKSEVWGEIDAKQMEKVELF